MKLLCAFFIAFAFFCVCALPGQSCAAENMDTKPVRIVATTFPVYLFTANICANVPNVKLQILIPSSAGCPHDFALRPQDMHKLAMATVLVMNGAGLENFLEKPLADIGGNLRVIDASGNIPVISTSARHDGHGHESGDPHPGNVNPHLFAAPENAAVMVRNIGASLAEIDPLNADRYLLNARGYSAALESLSEKFKSVGLQAKNRGIALEHDALEYLAQNANLKIVAIFENSLSASGIMEMAEVIKKTDPALLAGDSQYADRLLMTLGKETGIPYAQLNPCANGPDDAPLDYYQIVMEKNLEILKAHYDK